MQSAKLLKLIEKVARIVNELAEDEEPELSADLRDIEARMKVRWMQRRDAEKSDE